MKILQEVLAELGVGIDVLKLKLANKCLLDGFALLQKAVVSQRFGAAGCMRERTFAFDHKTLVSCAFGVSDGCRSEQLCLGFVV